MTAHDLARAVADGEYRFCPSTPDRCPGCEWDVERLERDIREVSDAQRRV